ncbi:polysaccharide pyruvyl transferase family protein [Candidatus Omnitrophota bacterium]
MGIEKAIWKARYYAKSFIPFWDRRIGFYENFGHGDLGDDTAFEVAEQKINQPLLPLSKRCNAFVPYRLKGLLIGGRAVFRWESPYVPRRLFSRKRWPFPVVLLAAGVNRDFNVEISRETKNMLCSLVDRCDYLSVRDLMSQRFLSDLGIYNTAIVPDLELALKPVSWELPFSKEGPTVGITVSPHSAFKEKIIERLITSIVTFIDYVNQGDQNVVFFPFDQIGADSTREKDMIANICKRVKNPQRVKVLQQHVSPGEMLFAIKELCDRMICTRLHSVAMATNAHIPFVVISFNDMHKAFLEMVELKECEISLFDELSAEKLILKDEYVVSCYNKIQDQLKKRHYKLSQMIEKEFLTIKKVLLCEKD